MSRTLGVRLDEETEALVDSLSESMNINKSQLLRKALQEWATIRQSIQRENMILSDRLLLYHLFQTLTDDEASRVAETMSEHIISIIRVKQIESGREETIGDFLGNFTRFNSTENTGWFQRINYTLDDEGRISVYGFHSLNVQYSRYAAELFTRILRKKFGYRPGPGGPRVTENSVILEYEPGGGTGETVNAR